MFGRATIRLGIGPHSSLRPVFAASPVRHVSDLHLKFALRPHNVCASIVDIQSATAEIRRGKKKRKNKGQDENIYGLPYYIGRP